MNPRRWLRRNDKPVMKRALREQVERYRCPHDDYLCDRYGCPDAPTWKGDRS